ncbi:amino acid permease [Dactylonectria macrodidyma]|uniref:Amino acid permease n=1 Tax=Dactylonectria macrodidyma TaxID=307937 RepID=A0A9P9ERC6_9HYPO|nr:amino acid permease [Dactylonectria macrodidyma]
MATVIPQDPGALHSVTESHGTFTESNNAGEITADKVIENLGYHPELQRNRSTAHVTFMAFILAANPYGLATTLNYPLTGGGPVNIIWGWLLVALLVVCVAASLGEITSVYPTAGGVYYQTAMLTPPNYRSVASWICGWLYVVGNMSITLSVNFGTASFFAACLNVFESEPGVGIFPSKPYQIFLLFAAITLLCNMISSLGNRWLPWIDAAAVFWTFAGVFAITISILVVAKEGRHSASYVFGHFENDSGWPDVWSFCIGLMHAGYATSSTGMILSMCEEVRQPTTQVPNAMVATACINTFAGLLFLIPLVFVLPDIPTLLATSAGQPTPAIIKSAVGSSGGSLALLLPLVMLGIICGVGCTTASSRCTWAIARDGALPGSKWWSQIDTRLKIPLNAMMLLMVLELLLGLLYFGSNTAFSAFSGVGVICLTCSYATPVAISLMTNRKHLQKAKFGLGRLGYVCNVLTMGWSILAVPLFCMPSPLPVTAASVNYAPVVFIAATVISVGWYFAWGRHHYTGPPASG